MEPAVSTRYLILAKTYVLVESQLNLALFGLLLKVPTDKFIISGHVLAVVNWTGLEYPEYKLLQ